MPSSHSEARAGLAARAARELDSASLENLCNQLDAGTFGTLDSITPSQTRLLLGELFAAWRPAGAAALGAALRAARAAHGFASRQSTHLVWTGPTLPGASFRSTDQALLELVDSASEDLLIVSFAAYRLPVLLTALEKALDRGVRIAFVLESAEESDGRLSFDAARALSPRLRAQCALYLWPRDQRPRRVTERGTLTGLLHAKCAVADGRTLLVSSANITEGALWLNLELGILLRGGDLPAKVRGHFEQLCAAGILRTSSG